MHSLHGGGVQQCNVPVLTSVADRATATITRVKKRAAAHFLMLVLAPADQVEKGGGWGHAVALGLQRAQQTS